MVFKGADHLGRYRSSTMSFNIDDFNFINTPLLEEDTEMEAPSLPVALEAANEDMDLSLIPLQVYIKMFCFRVLNLPLKIMPSFKIASKFKCSILENIPKRG